MRIERWGSGARRTSKGLLAIATIAIAATCIAAGYGLARVNAGDWKSSTETALGLLASDLASDEQRRDAIYVIYRNERLIREAIERESGRPSDSAKHARIAAEKARAGWAK